MGNNCFSLSCNRVYLREETELDFNKSIKQEKSKSALTIQNRYRQHLAYSSFVHDLADQIESMLLKTSSSLIITVLTRKSFQTKLEENPTICEIIEKYSAIMKKTKDNILSPQIGIRFHDKKSNSTEYYYGEWNLQGQKHGIGTFISPDGVVFHGSFKAGMFHGPGLYINVNGDYYYGNFVNGKAEGKGKLVLGNGVKYEGEWKENLKHGEGRETYQDGSYYQGSFSNNEKEGTGEYFYPDGSYYKGSFSGSQFNGKGQYLWQDRRYFEGFFKDGKMNGSGVHQWPDGSYFRGEYLNDKKSGIGTYTWASGKEYSGQWLNNKPHGEGSFVNGDKQYKICYRFGKIISLQKNNAKKYHQDDQLKNGHGGMTNNSQAQLSSDMISPESGDHRTLMSSPPAQL